MYLNKLKIGNIELENNIILAPMAGITDLPFRVICKKFGPSMVVTEMVSSRGIYHDDYKTKKLMKIADEQKVVAVQIFGSEPESMGYAAKEVSNFAEIIDINMGCPAPKVVKNGDGSKLLLDLERVKDILESVVQNSKVPVTLKYRKGWDNEHIVAVEVAKIAEKSGISAVTIHGRTRDQFYSGKVDKDIIREVKNAVNIPVIASGDIVDEKTALEMFEYTGVDGIMIGRASIGNPWIFKRINHFLETGKKINIPSNEEKLQIIKEHIDLAVREKGEEVAIKEMRKHLAMYVKGMPGASDFRNSINKIETRLEVIEALEKYFCNINVTKN